MPILNTIIDAVKDNVSDIFIIVGTPVSYRKYGVIHKEDDKDLTPEESEKILRKIYQIAGREFSILEKEGDDDFSFSIKSLSRFRISAYRQRGTYSAVVRIISYELPKPEELGIPEQVLNMGCYNNGLVLITGPAGSGKSTTLSCIINHVNETAEKHIITLEDPIEYLHQHKKSLVSQREIGVDAKNYTRALKAALRQSPDIILLGEMREYETIGVAMTAAETGHLVLSTMHTIGASNTIDRILDVFPPNQQRQIAVQLAMSLRAVVSQQLVPTIDGEQALAYEILTVTPAIGNMIRENKIHQIEGTLHAASQEYMISMDNSLFELYKNGKITEETAIQYATSKDYIEKKIHDFNIM